MATTSKLFVYLLLCVLVQANGGAAALLNNSLPPPPSPPPPSPPPPPSSYAVLSAISLSSGTLVPAFNVSTFTYTASVGSSVSKLQVNLTVPREEVAAGYGVSVDGAWIESGASGPTLQLSDQGETVLVSIYVLSIGYIPSLYTIDVTREEESSSRSRKGRLGAWYRVLIVVACVVVLALVIFALCWVYRKGWFPCLPAPNPIGDYRSLS